MSTDIAKRVEFTRQQVEYLNKQFPEMVGTASTSTDELRFRAGQRSVLAFLLNRVAGITPGE